jgi:hypothetical protein
MQGLVEGALLLPLLQCCQEQAVLVLRHLTLLLVTT